MALLAVICSCNFTESKICENCIKNNDKYIMSELDKLLHNNIHSNNKVETITKIYEYILTIPEFMRRIFERR
jgi:hypothetical protein